MDDDALARMLQEQEESMGGNVDVHFIAESALNWS